MILYLGMGSSRRTDAMILTNLIYFCRGQLEKIAVLWIRCNDLSREPIRPSAGSVQNFVLLLLRVVHSGQALL